jgi:hypothetical protein
MLYNKFVKKEINQLLNKQHYYSRVAVEFLPTEEGESSKIVYMTEPEIRALQVLVAQKVEVYGWEIVKEWLSHIVVYDGPTKRGSKPMVFRPDGLFETEFQGGFYSTNSNLALELF